MSIYIYTCIYIENIRLDKESNSGPLQRSKECVFSIQDSLEEKTCSFLVNVLIYMH